MVLDENGRGMIRIDLTDVEDLVDDDIARLQLVVALYLSLSHVTCAGDVLIEVVGMCGADVGDVATSLCECCGIGGVGVNHALDIGECLVEYQVSGRVAGGVENTIDHFARLKIDDNHVGCLHHVVVDTRRLDDYQTFFTVDTRYISPCEDDESLLHEVKISLEYFFFQFF